MAHGFSFFLSGKYIRLYPFVSCRYGCVMRRKAHGRAHGNAMVQQTALKRDAIAKPVGPNPALALISGAIPGDFYATSCSTGGLRLFPYCISGLYKRVEPVP